MPSFISFRCTSLKYRDDQEGKELTVVLKDTGTYSDGELTLHFQGKAVEDAVGTFRVGDAYSVDIRYFRPED